MTKLRYTLNDPHPIDSDAERTIFLPWCDVAVKGGYAEAEDAETVEALLWRGFEVVEEPVTATRKRVRK